MFLGSPTDNYDAETGQWAVAALAVDQTETLTITALVTAAGTATNLAEVTAADQSDPDLGDNQASVMVTPQVADLSLVKTVDDSSATIGQDVTFTIAVNNAGPDAATNVTVADQLPEGLEFVRATPSGRLQRRLRHLDDRTKSMPARP